MILQLKKNSSQLISCVNFKVSVITSIYKSSKFLFDFLKDVKRQSIFPKSEILLLDANEDDEDYKIIEPFLAYRNFKYHRIGKCSIYEAWNKGIELSSSDILTNWNTDDRRSYNSLYKQVEFLENNPDIDLCYGQVYETHKENDIFEFTKSQILWPIFDGTLENLLKHNSPHCFPVWRKCIHKRFGLFNINYNFAADYDMWFRILKGGGKIFPINEIIGLYYKNPSGISTDVKNLEKAIGEVNLIKSIYSK